MARTHASPPAPWTAALAAACLVSCATPAPRAPPGGDDVHVPDGMWSARLVPGVHSGPPSLAFAIDDAFPWPRAADGAAGAVLYRVFVRGADGAQIGGDAWLTPAARAAQVPLPPPALLPWLRPGGTGAAAALEAEDALDRAARAAVFESEALPSPDAVDRLAKRMRRDEFQHHPADAAHLAGAGVVLQPVAGGTVLLDRLLGAAAAPKYTWGVPIAEAGHPCDGRLPEACVRRKLERVRERLCNRRNGDGTPRFPRECLVFGLLLASEPARVHVRCTLRLPDGGVAAAFVDPLSLDIDVNGDHFVDADFPEGVILHELQHVFDAVDGNAEATRERARLDRRASAAMEAVRAALAAGDEAAVRFAVADAHAASEAHLRLRRPAGRERLRAECAALFRVLENADLFDETDDGVSWLAGSIKSMVAELASVQQSHGLLPGRAGDAEAAPILCECYRRMRDWVRDHPGVKSRLDRDEALPGTTWTRHLDDLVAEYCP